MATRAGGRRNRAATQWQWRQRDGWRTAVWSGVESRSAPGQAEHTLRHNVALDLGGAARDRPGERAQVLLRPRPVVEGTIGALVHPVRFEVRQVPFGEAVGAGTLEVEPFEAQRVLRQSAGALIGLAGEQLEHHVLGRHLAPASPWRSPR